MYLISPVGSPSTHAPGFKSTSLLRNSDGKIAIGDDPTGGYGTFIGQSELLLYTTVNRALDNKAGLLRPNQYQGLKGVSVEVVVLV